MTKISQIILESGQKFAQKSEDRVEYLGRLKDQVFSFSDGDGQRVVEDLPVLGIPRLLGQVFSNEFAPRLNLCPWGRTLTPNVQSFVHPVGSIRSS
jgi:hypothetical protein